MSHDDTTPEANPISPTERAEKAIERRVFTGIYRIILYAVGAIAVGGAGIGAHAHTRISDNQDQLIGNTKDIETLKEALTRELNERRAHDIKVDEKLDRLLELIYDRQTHLLEKP